MSSPQLQNVRFQLNGSATECEVEPRSLLSDMLRIEFGLTGLKVACGYQVCGACTVLIDNRPTSACCTLAAEADGRSVETVEGIASEGELNPVQQALIEAGAIQCGFCIPGIVLSLTREFRLAGGAPSDDSIDDSLNGHWCRCGNYRAIREAADQAKHRERSVSVSAQLAAQKENRP